MAAPSGLAIASASPEAVVNKRGAVRWALRNWNGSNNGFGNDCADFVSQALAAGGGDPMSVSPYPFKRRDDHYWFMIWYRTNYVWSHSWTVAEDLAVHQEDIKSYFVKHTKNAVPGDIIFANWNGTKFSGISHVGIITKMVHGEPYITQHTPDQKNISLHYWLTHGGKHVTVWIASPNKH